MDGLHQNVVEATGKSPARKLPSLEQRIRLSLRLGYLHYLLKNQRVIVICLVLLMVLLEVIEHTLILEYGERAHILYDGILYIVLVPAGAWLLLLELKRIENERERERVDNDLHTEFSQQLGSAGTWDELLKRIVTYPHRVAPRANITLFVYNSTSLRMLPEAACSRDGQVTLKPQITISPDSLPLGSLPQLLLQNGVQLQSSEIPTIPVVENGMAAPPREPFTAAPSMPPHRYDLPITRSEQQIAVIKLEYPLGSAPTQDEIRTLKSATPVIALALEGALLQALAAEQAAASEAQRQQVAQHLHDTLAQNISYLRLKLDQITGENTIREIGAVLQELERMRTTAEEAYQQVRNTLDELNPTQSENLVSTLFKQARAISERACFELRISQAGAYYPLPAAVRQQILYIVREAFYNIEKHANAHQVRLTILWLESELIIKIADDGVGFNPLSVPADGHYGLWIMQQRAHEIGGTLKIGAATDNVGTPGTEVTLWVPCPVQKAGGERPPVGEKPVVDATISERVP